MKCPKCGYISFDFNQICPKCNKEVGDQREKMGLPPFRPSPLSLLGALTGETEDSSIGLSMEGGAPEMAGEGVDFSPEDSQAIEAMEEAFQDGSGLELPSEESSDELDIADLITVTPEDIGDEEEGTPASLDEEAASLDLDELAGDETDVLMDEVPSAVPDLDSEEDVALDIDDLELDAEPARDESQELNLDLESDLGGGGGEALSEEVVALEEDLSSEDTAVFDVGDTEGEKTQVLTDEEEAVDIENLDLDLELDEPDK